MADAIHVVPRGDLVEHDTSTAEPDCICGPVIEPATREVNDDGSIGWVLVHHSLDGRETAEPAS